MENFAFFLALMFLFGFPVIAGLVIVAKAVFAREHCKGCKCKKK